MRNHIERCEEYKNYQDNQAVLAQEPISASEDSSQPVVRGFSQDDVRRETIKMIILDELPFSHVENIEFRHFCCVVCLRYVVPSRRTIIGNILDLFLA